MEFLIARCENQFGNIKWSENNFRTLDYEGESND